MGSTVLAVAVSSDGQPLASGDVGKNIHVWSIKESSLEKLHTFRGHRDAVSGLVFRRGTHTLYSASWDRSVKIWSVDERAYVETLFGHQDKICALDAGSRERCVTAGGRDGSARVWKIVEESQLVFNGPQTSHPVHQVACQWCPLSRHRLSLDRHRISWHFIQVCRRGLGYAVPARSYFLLVHAQIGCHQIFRDDDFLV